MNKEPKVDKLVILGKKINFKEETFESFIDNLKDTHYYEYLKNYKSSKDEDALFSIGMNLEKFYYRNLTEATKFFSKDDVEEFKKIFGVKIDLLNIIWIYRAKKYYNISPEEIFNFTIFGGNYNSEKLLKLSYLDEREFEEEIRNSKYGALFAEGRVIVTGRTAKKIMYSIVKKNFRRTDGIGKFMSFLILLDYEIANIERILEGTIFGLNKNEKLKYMIVDREGSEELAVEKMKVANIIGNISDMDSVVLDILNLKCMQFMSTEANIAENKFTFSLDNEENLERNLELNYISPIEEDESHKSTAKKATEIMDFLGFDKIDESYFEKVNVNEDIDYFVKNISDKLNEYEKTKENLKILDTLKESYELFKNVDIDLKDIADLKYFNSRFGFLDKDARQRLKKNYGNILAMIYHTGTVDNRELFLVIYPKEAEKDVDRLLNSLNFTEVELLGENVEGTANLIYKNLEEEEENVKRKIFEIEEYKKNLLESRNEELKTTLAHMLSYEGIEKAKRYMLKSNKYFYLSGWIGDSDKSKLEKNYPNIGTLILSISTQKAKTWRHLQS